MSAAMALDVSLFDVSHTEWRMLSAHSCNVLLEGDVTATDTVLRLLQPLLREPIVSHWPRSPLDLPSGEARALILRDAAALSRDEQRRLLAWMGDTGSQTQVITMVSCPLFARVAAGLFDAALYYRLNVLLLRVTPPFEAGIAV
jgi:Sigma-54 interaction domain